MPGVPVKTIVALILVQIVSGLSMAKPLRCNALEAQAGGSWSESHQQADRPDAYQYSRLKPFGYYESPWLKDFRRGAQLDALNKGAEFALRRHHPGFFLDGQYDAARASEFIHREPGHLLAWALGKSDFAPLRAELGSNGFWLLFRSYSFPKLGFPNAIPHMSLMIGEKVYEIGRPLVTDDGVRVVSKMPTGPIAIPVGDYMYKAQLAEQELNAKPGLFFGVWIAGVGPETLKYLTDYFEGRAKKFSQDKKFAYNANGQGQDCDNCMTYINKPLIDLQYRTQGADKIGINGFFRTPGPMLNQFDHYLPPRFDDDRERAPVFMFVDDDWLKDTEDKFPRQYGSRPLPLFAEPHPQFEGFFVRQTVPR